MSVIHVVRYIGLDTQPTRFREAWFDGASAVFHEGVIGRRGRVESVPSGFDLGTRLINAFKLQAERENYQIVTHEMMTDVGIVIITSNGISVQNLDVRHRLEEELDQVLGWTGNGRCTGGSIGEEAIEIFCEVVIPTSAIRTIRKTIQRVAPQLKQVTFTQESRDGTG